VRLWWGTGVPTWNVLGGVFIHTFTFAALLSIGALASMSGQGGVALPVMAPIAAFTLSQFLMNREQLLYDYITSELGRRCLDWVYYILPKCTEIQNAAAAFVRSSTIPSSWPLWTTGLFTMAALITTMWVLERKSF
jgi:hypothetical protein